jgi:hypothetical protein
LMQYRGSKLSVILSEMRMRGTLLSGSDGRIWWCCEAANHDACAWKSLLPLLLTVGKTYSRILFGQISYLWRSMLIYWRLLYHPGLLGVCTLSIWYCKLNLFPTPHASKTLHSVDYQTVSRWRSKTQQSQVLCTVVGIL